MDNSVKNIKGFWTDFLGAKEVEFSVNAGEELKPIKWATSLLQENKISRALRFVPNPERSLQELREIKSAFFEVRFAYALFKSGVTAQYEFSSGMGKSSVDFFIPGNDQRKAGWLVELTSLRDSNAVKENTWQEGPFFRYASISAPNENAPEVRDIIKTQQAILSKVGNEEGNPIKFPVPDGETFNLIVVDIRAFSAGNSDIFDYYNIAYGSPGLQKVNYGFYCRTWVDEKGNREYIRGVFDPKYPEPNSKHLRERVHALGFLREEKYAKGEISSNFILFPNPGLISENEWESFRFMGWNNYRDVWREKFQNG